jgi:hypothetical protein
MSEENTKVSKDKYFGCQVCGCQKPVYCFYKGRIVCVDHATQEFSKMLKEMVAMPIRQVRQAKEGVV